MSSASSARSRSPLPDPAGSGGRPTAISRAAARSARRRRRAFPRSAHSRDRGGRRGRRSSRLERRGRRAPARPRRADRSPSPARPSALGTPRTSAEAPCTVMLAPMRISSGTCMKRFSKIVSVIIEAPSAIAISAMTCACRSVGKPGKGSVITSTPASRPLRRRTAQAVRGLGDARPRRVRGCRRTAATWSSRAPIELHVAAGRRRRHHIGAGLDAVGDDAVRARRAGW